VGDILLILNSMTMSHGPAHTIVARYSSDQAKLNPKVVKFFSYLRSALEERTLIFYGLSVHYRWMSYNFLEAVFL